MILNLLTIILASIIINYASTSSPPPSKYSNKRFHEWTWLVSHNSHLNWDDNSVIYQAANQLLSIDKQLKAGVRGFMFDIDWKTCTELEEIFKACSCKGICLCHGECDSNSVGAIKDGFSVKTLEYALRKIVYFLNKPQNREEIVTIFLEDYISDVKKLQAVFDRVKSFNDLVFNPYTKQWSVSSKGWPLISQMVNSNKRILIIDDEQRGIHYKQRPGLIRSRDFLLQNHFEWNKSQKYEWNTANFSIKSFDIVKSIIVEDRQKQEEQQRRRTNNSVILNTTSLFSNTSVININFTISPNYTFGVEIPDCFSLHRVKGKYPMWDLDHQLDMKARENSEQVINEQKLFLFNNFIGVGASKEFSDPFTANLVNTKEFIMKRLKEKCYPGIDGKKPNYIALDFIDESTYKDVIVPFNEG